MSDPPHRIRRQRWNVRTGLQTQAFEVRKLLNDHWEDLFLPSLATAFDELHVGRRTVQIPRLEIRVRVDSVDKIPTALPELILQLLREELALAVSRDNRLLSEQSRLGNADSHSLERIVESDPEELNLETLIHYLRTGDLPWHQKSPETSDIVRALAETARHERMTISGRVLSGSFADTVAVLFRWLQIAGNDGSPLIVEAVLAAREQAVRNIVCAVVNLLAETATRFNSHARLRLAAFLIAASMEKSAPFVSELAETIRLTLVRGNGETERPGREQWESLESVAARQMLATWMPELSSDFMPEQAGAVEVGHTREPALLSEGPKEFEKPSQVTPQNREGQLPFAVSHAGLILLHPYLTRFFESLRIRQPGESRLSLHSLSRAAALLHFLATGHEDVYEFELGFVKVLLGLTPGSPIPVSSGLLSEEDRREAHSLLTAATSHWDALKNTSVEGFRTSFLQRRGFLSEDEQGWRLQIEPRSFDVLLNYLPWAISTVRLLWSTKPIYTDWRTH